MALRAHTRGGPEQLRYEPAPVPAVGPGEVLVAVHAAGMAQGREAYESGHQSRPPGKTILTVR